MFSMACQHGLIHINLHLGVGILNTMCPIRVAVPSLKGNFIFPIRPLSETIV
jgi:hypothetical protein